MESFIKKLSRTISFIILFFLSAFFYFNFKGFAYVDGKIVLQNDAAQAQQVEDIISSLPVHGAARVLPANIHINASDKFAIGSLNAPITLYEYSSLGCPHCADFHTDVLPRLIEEYVSQGLLRVVFVNFPLDRKSMRAAMISECMSYENYHQFLNTLFSNQRSWWLDRDDERLYRYAAEHGMGYEQTNACAHNDNIAREIVSNRQQALTQLHIQGTPAFLFSGADGNEIIYGALNYAKARDYLNLRLYGPQPVNQ